MDMSRLPHNIASVRTLKFTDALIAETCSRYVLPVINNHPVLWFSSLKM